MREGHVRQINLDDTHVFCRTDQAVGSVERVVAALLEHFQGRLPLWLAPVQICVLPVGPDQDRAARDLVDTLIAAGLRPRLEVDGSLGARIRASRRRRDCVIAVIGKTETDQHLMQVTDIGSDFQGPVAQDRFVSTLENSYRMRAKSINWSTPHPSH